MCSSLRCVHPSHISEKTSKNNMKKNMKNLSVFCRDPNLLIYQAFELSAETQKLPSTQAAPLKYILPDECQSLMLAHLDDPKPDILSPDRYVLNKHYDYFVLVMTTFI